MLGRIKQPLAEAKWLGTPATAAGTTAEGYVQALRGVAGVTEGGRPTKDDVSIRLLERWLAHTHRQASVLVVDEGLLGEMRTQMTNGGFVRHDGKPFKSLAKQVAACVRSLHNQGFRAGHSTFTRPLVDDRTLPRYQRYLQLTPKTQAAMTWFEEEGTRPGKTAARGTTLTVASRALGISEAFWLLSRLNMNALEEITTEMVTGLIPTTGPDDAGYRRIIRAINGVSALFKCCVAKGLLPVNPTTGVSHCKFTNHQQRDFLPPDELAKARDTATLDRTNDAHVIDRLVLLLFLDTALRRGELASLSRKQVTKVDGGFAVRLLPGNQKMSGKPAVDLHVLYPETTDILDLYLTKVRPRLSRPDATGLIVDGRGHSASALALVAACARDGERLGLKTYYRRGVPSPHDLRRTFAMCNASPLGLDLHPHELAERLRDNIEVVFNHYVTSNPLINAQRARVYRMRAGSLFDDDKAREVVRTLKSWHISSKLVTRLEREIAKIRAAGEPLPAQEDSGDEWIDESQAHALLAQKWGAAPFWKKFRRHMRAHNAMRRAEKFGKVVFKASVVHTLANEYVSYQMLKANAAVERTRLAQALTGENVLTMGRMTLIRKDAVGSLIDFGGDRDSSSTAPAAVQTSNQNRSKHASVGEIATRKANLGACTTRLQASLCE